MKKYIVAGALVASLVSGSALPVTAAAVDVPACNTAAANPTDDNVLLCLAALNVLPEADRQDTFDSLPGDLQTAVADLPGSNFQTGAGPVTNTGGGGGGGGVTFTDTPSSGGGGPTLTTDPNQSTTTTPGGGTTTPGGGTPGSRT